MLKDWGNSPLSRADVQDTDHERCWTSLHYQLEGRGLEDVCNSWVRSSHKEGCPYSFGLPLGGVWCDHQPYTPCG